MKITFRLYRDGPQKASNTLYYFQMIQSYSEEHLGTNLDLISTIILESEETINAFVTIVNSHKGDQEVLITRLKEKKITVTLIERRKNHERDTSSNG